MEATTTIDRKNKAFEITGTLPTATVKMQLDFLRNEGILIDLNITGTGMFQRTPDWAELGIPDFAGDRRATQFTKGSKYMYPEEKVKKVKSFESRVRQNLEKHTREITGFKPYRWMPYTAYATWRAKHDAILAEAVEFIETELIGAHAQAVEQIKASFTEIAESAWLSTTTGTNEKGRRVQKYQAIIVYDRATGENRTLNRQQFITYIANRAVEQVPSVEQIRSKLRFDYTTALFNSYQDVAADEAAAANIRAQVEFSRDQAAAERERMSLENQLFSEQVRKQVWDNQYEQRKKEEMLEAIRQAELEHHREQLKETVSPFVEVYRQAMMQFIEHAREILESVQKNQHVKGKVAERGRGLLDIYNLMVLPGLGDDRMMQYLADLRGLLGPADASASRDTDKIVSKLNDIIALEADVTRLMLAEPTTFEFIEVE